MAAWTSLCLDVYLQEAHAHGPVSSLRVPPSDPREERCGEMPPRQGQRDH